MFKDITNKHRLSIVFLWESVFQKHRTYFFVAFLAMLVEQAISIVIPYLSRYEMDQLVEKNTTFLLFSSSPFGIFLIILAVIFFANLLQSMTQFGFELITNVKKEQLENDLSLSIYERIRFLDPGLSLSIRHQRLMERVQHLATEMPQKIESLVIDKAKLIITLGSTFVIFSLVDPLLFVIIFVSAGLSYAIDRGREIISLRFSIENTYELDNVVWSIRNLMNHHYHHIVVNGASKHIMSQLSSILSQVAQSKRKEALSNISWRIADIINGDLIQMVIKWYIGYIIYYSTGSIGLMTMVIMYTDQIRRVVRDLFKSWIDRNKLVDDLSRLELFLTMTQNLGSDRRKQLSTPLKDITVKNLSFSYPKAVETEMGFIDIEIRRIESYKRRESWRLDELHALQEAKAEMMAPSPIILDDISLRLERGNVYGIVGKNGAGKTTLINLLLGFFSNYEGSLCYNNTEGKALEYDTLHSLASYVSQEPFIMKGQMTIRDNLTLGVSRTVTDDELWSLMETFQMKKKVEKTRLGLDSPVGWDQDLSGGQKQILAIIRTILQDRPILILDEGTNQLDAENELKIMDLLLQEKQNKIVIFVTHRMSTMRHADKIYCMDSWKIASSGTHETLILSENPYSHFWKIQHG